MLKRIIQKCSLPSSFFSISSRRISIIPEKTWPVYDKNNKVGAVVLETASDQLPEEAAENYFLRSRSQLSEAIKREFHAKPGHYLFFKVNQCVLSPKNIKIGRRFSRDDIYFIGHATLGLFHVNAAGLHFDEESLVSKVPLTNFKGAREIKSALFTPRIRYAKALAVNSKEFFIICHFESLKISVDAYRENFNTVKLVGAPYELSESACGQAIQAVLGVPVDSDVSPQVAVEKSVFSILMDDAIFRSNFRNAEIATKFSRMATELGAEYEAKLNNNQYRIR